MSETTLHHRLTSTLSAYVPEAVLGFVVDEIVQRKIILTITQKRQSLYGDYRAPDFKAGHRISVNGDLNRFAFFITFVHELAHLQVWMQHRHRAVAHGIEWKQIYRQLMQPFIVGNVFPDDISNALKNYMHKTGASSCNDVLLSKALAVYDKHAGTFVSDLMPGDVFEYENKGEFKRGEKLRKRIKCLELKTNRIYLFSPATVVKKKN